jgi:hypothetical protein
VLAVAATITGVLTLQASAEYTALFDDDPRAGSVQSRGELLRGLTNGLWIATGVFGVASVVVLTRTSFSASRSEATISFTPTAGGALGVVRGRF